MLRDLEELSTAEVAQVLGIEPATVRQRVHRARLMLRGYALTRWDALARYVTDGRLEMSNNAVERAIRPLALGRKNWLFVGVDSAGERAATAYTIIQTARLNGVEPYLYLRTVIAKIADHPMKRIDELLPWNISL